MQKDKDTTKQKEELTNTTLRSIPKSWIKILKEEGFTFSGYARLAVKRAMIQDGYLKP